MAVLYGISLYRTLRTWGRGSAASAALDQTGRPSS
jgi:hypothetical protein